MQVMVGTLLPLCLGVVTLVDTGSSIFGVQCVFHGNFELCISRKLYALTTQTLCGYFVHYTVLFIPYDTWAARNLFVSLLSEEQP